MVREHTTGGAFHAQFRLACDFANNPARNVLSKRPRHRIWLAIRSTRHNGRTLFFAKPDIQWFHNGSRANISVADSDR